MANIDKECSSDERTYVTSLIRARNYADNLGDLKGGWLTYHLAVGVANARETSPARHHQLSCNVTRQNTGLPLEKNQIQPYLLSRPSSIL